MRTTLDVADDVLAAAKELARLENTTAGAVLSRLARQALTAQVAPSGRSAAGFRTIPRGGNVVTNDHVNAIREAEGI
ncbi:MAG: CopG family transcriptional regulator [Polaromonas sp.]|nr:CopG family transcriptional regulator [Polaromonas sp.]